VDDQTLYIDLLFYHVRLHRYFVFELKVGDFEPEYAGKLSFYLSGVNRTMRTPVEGPSIGVLLCESRSGPMVEFALENINQPIGVSTYRVAIWASFPVRTPAPIVNDWGTSPNKEVLCCAFYWWRQPRLRSARTPTGDVASFIWRCVVTAASLRLRWHANWPSACTGCGVRDSITNRLCGSVRTRESLDSSMV